MRPLAFSNESLFEKIAIGLITDFIIAFAMCLYSVNYQKFIIIVPDWTRLELLKKNQFGQHLFLRVEIYPQLLGFFLSL